MEIVLFVLGVVFVLVYWNSPAEKERSRAAHEALQAKWAKQQAAQERRDAVALAKVEREAQREAIRLAQLEKSSTPPEVWLARWRIVYMDAEGVTTERVIRITAVRPTLGHVEAWCELRNADRKFVLAAILDAGDPDSGDEIDVDEWMRAYRASRRKKVASALGPGNSSRAPEADGTA